MLIVETFDVREQNPAQFVDVSGHMVAERLGLDRADGGLRDGIVPAVPLGAQPRTLDEYVSEQTTHRLECELGIRQTAPRDLAEYDRLPPSLATEAPGADGADHEETTAWQPHPAPEADAPEALPTKPLPTKPS